MKEKDPKKRNDEEEEERRKARNYIRRLLKYRPRSQKEIKAKLKSQGYSSQTIKDTVQWAEEKDLVNDELFVKYWINDRLENKPKGKSGLYKELLDKGVSKGIIKKELNDLLPDQKEKRICRELIEDRLKRYEGEETDDQYRKTLNFISRRGFRRGLAHNILKEILFD